MSEVIIFFLNNVTVILISLILLSNFFVVFSCVHSDSSGANDSDSQKQEKNHPFCEE